MTDQAEKWFTVQDPDGKVWGKFPSAEAASRVAQALSYLEGPGKEAFLRYVADQTQVS